MDETYGAETGNYAGETPQGGDAAVLGPVQPGSEGQLGLEHKLVQHPEQFVPLTDGVIATIDRHGGLDPVVAADLNTQQGRETFRQVSNMGK